MTLVLKIKFISLLGKQHILDDQTESLELVTSGKRGCTYLNKTSGAQSATMCCVGTHLNFRRRI